MLRPILLSFLFLVLAAPAAADAPRKSTPSGLPVPRFASIKYGEAACRIGPTFRHPVAATYRRKGLPVLIVAETIDHWRKIRDVDGEECWVHQTALRALSHVMTLHETELKVSPKGDSAPRARLAARVVARLDGEKREWRKVSASGIEGWVNESDLWGAVVASHN
jgi:SH3-like domain-containing protein